MLVYYVQPGLLLGFEKCISSNIRALVEQPIIYLTINQHNDRVECLPIVNQVIHIGYSNHHMEQVYNIQHPQNRLS